VTGYGY